MHKLYISQSETLEVILCKPQPMALFNLSNMGKPINPYNCVFPYCFLFHISLSHFNLSPLTFSSPEHLSRQMLWSLAQSKMIKALPEAGTGKGGGQQEMRGRGHRGHWWKSVEVVPANSCCASRAPVQTHAPIGRNSASRAPDREGERDRKRDERRGKASGNAGNEVEMSTLSHAVSNSHSRPSEGQERLQATM